MCIPSPTQPPLLLSKGRKVGGYAPALLVFTEQEDGAMCRGPRFTYHVSQLFQNELWPTSVAGNITASPHRPLLSVTFYGSSLTQRPLASKPCKSLRYLTALITQLYFAYGT